MVLTRDLDYPRLMVSVCMATYNGEKYLQAQIQSILGQLAPNDEIIISDDSSSDNTLKVINSFSDPRIKLHIHQKRNLIKNFENALKKAKGDYIFLADQDDLWEPYKIKKCLDFLQNECVLVVSNCSLINENDELIAPSFFSLRNPSKGFWKNVYKNSYMGCCMAFRRSVLDRALPFPQRIPMHDSWIGLIAASMGSVTWLDTPLIKYRRHSQTATVSEKKSSQSLMKRLENRFFLLGGFILRRFNFL